jgi:hypothetical protein
VGEEARAGWLQQEGLDDPQLSPFSPHPSSSSATTTTTAAGMMMFTSSRTKEQWPQYLSRALGKGRLQSSEPVVSDSETVQQLPSSPSHSYDDITFYPHVTPSSFSPEKDEATSERVVEGPGFPGNEA